MLDPCMKTCIPTTAHTLNIPKPDPTESDWGRMNDAFEPDHGWPQITNPLQFNKNEMHWRSGSSFPCCSVSESTSTFAWRSQFLLIRASKNFWSRLDKSLANNELPTMAQSPAAQATFLRLNARWEKRNILYFLAIFPALAADTATTCESLNTIRVVTRTWSNLYRSSLVQSSLHTPLIYLAEMSLCMSAQKPFICTSGDGGFMLHKGLNVH